MFRIFLKGILRNKINVLMTTAALNFIKWMGEIKLYLYLIILKLLTAFYVNKTYNI